MTTDESRPAGEAGSAGRPPSGNAPTSDREADCPGEMDLVDIGVSLWRRWKLMSVVFVVVFGLALALALSRKMHFEYSAVMQLGTVTLLDHGPTLIDSQSVATQLQQVYIPQALAEAEAHGVRLARNLKIDVAAEGNGELIALSTTATRRAAPAVRTLLQHIVGAASAAINSRIADYATRNRRFLKHELDAIRKREDALRDQVARLSGRSGEGAAAASYVATEVAALVQQAAQWRQQLEVFLPTNIERAGLVGRVTTSAKPVGFHRAIIGILGAIVALLAALLSAAVVNYGAAVRRRFGAAAAGA